MNREASARAIAYEVERRRLQVKFPDLDYRRLKVSRERVIFNNQSIQDSRWIGKPWRRISLLVNYYIWKGEASLDSWSFSLHFRIFGLMFLWDITRAPGYDYEEERP